jgi:hypothetical protein
MKASQLAAIRARLESAPDFTPRMHSYGTVVVMISCANERQARALTDFLSHVRADISALLKDIDCVAEPEQTVMEL